MNCQDSDYTSQVKAGNTHDSPMHTSLLNINFVKLHKCLCIRARLQSWCYCKDAAIDLLVQVSDSPQFVFVPLYENVSHIKVYVF